MRFLHVITALAALGAVSACAQAPMASVPAHQPSPVVAPAPPPNPVMVAPVPDVSQPVVVYFDLNKAEISASTMQILYGAMPAIKAAQPQVIRIHGFTDAAGKAAYNQALSTKRAQAVADQLRKLGITASRIEVTGNGSGNAKSGPKDQSKRRVEITWDAAPKAAVLPAPAPATSASASDPFVQALSAMHGDGALAASIEAETAPATAPVAVKAATEDALAPAVAWAGLGVSARGPPTVSAQI